MKATETSHAFLSIVLKEQGGLQDCGDHTMVTLSHFFIMLWSDQWQGLILDTGRKLAEVLLLARKLLSLYIIVTESYAVLPELSD